MTDSGAKSGFIIIPRKPCPVSQARLAAPRSMPGSLRIRLRLKGIIQKQDGIWADDKTDRSEIETTKRAERRNGPNGRTGYWITDPSIHTAASLQGPARGLACDSFKASSCFDRNAS